MWSGRQGLLRVYVCCGSSLTGDLTSAVWPAGFAACVCCSVCACVVAFVRVLWLLPDRRPAECGLAGRVWSVCCGSSLTGDLPSAVWSDLHAVVNFLSVTLVGLVAPIVSCHHLFMCMYKSSMHFLHPFAGTPSQSLIKGAKNSLALTVICTSTIMYIIVTHFVKM